MVGIGCYAAKVFNRFTISIALAASLAVAFPVFAAIWLAHHSASEYEKTYVSTLANEALTRSEQTADQVLAGSRLVNSLPSRDICSPIGLALMQRIDLDSTLLQAVGHLNDRNVIDCSSIDSRRSFAIGPPDIISKSGVRIWIHVKLYPGRQTYLLIAKGSFVGVVHRALPLSFVDNVSGLAVSAFSWSHRRPLVERGHVDPLWITQNARSDNFFRRSGYSISVVRSKRYDIGVIAAVPWEITDNFGSNRELILLPLGLVIGLLLAMFLVTFIRTRLSMPSMIRSALKAGEFHLLYQPVIDLKTGTTVGAEALIRWRRSDGVTIPPDNFIGVAEKTGVIRLITRRVLEILTDDVRSVLKINPDFHFAVNFSAADIHSDDACDEVRRFSARSGLPLNQFIVEATEQSFVDAARASETFRRLRSIGVKVAIDDFGTGYSSLGYLARLEIDFLKIDKLFVDAVGTNSATSHVAERIIEMAKDLKLQIMAEGIEQPAQAKWLQALGVEFAQGYHFARPMTADALSQRLEAERKLALIFRQGSASAA